MVAWKGGSVKNVAVAVAACLAMGVVVACATTPSSELEDSAVTSWLTDLEVETGNEATVVTLVGVRNPIYTALFNEELRAVVVDLSAVDSSGGENLVEVYDGLVDYVTVSSYSEGVSEPVTRVEIALAKDAEFEVDQDSGGMRLTLVAQGGSGMDSALSGGTDPWGTVAGDSAESGMDLGEEIVEAGADAESTMVAVENSEIPDPPVATSLEDVVVSTTDSGALVHLKGDGTIWAVESFVLENPARFVMDLQGLEKKASKDKVKVGSSVVDKVRIGGHEGKVRVVIDGGVEASGFDGRTLKPAADGLFIALGSGDDLAQALEDGIATADAAWREKALGDMAPGGTDLAGDIDSSNIDWNEEGDAPANIPDAAWDGADGAAEVEDSGSMEITDAGMGQEDMASATRIYGIHYQMMDDVDRIAILSEGPVDYAMLEPDADTVIFSFPGAVIDSAVAGHVRGKKGGPVSLITVFQQPDVPGSEVRLVISRAANQKPEISEAGTNLFIDFADMGIAAVVPPAFPEIPTSKLASKSEAMKIADGVEATEGELAGMTGETTETASDELPEFADNPSMDGPATLDQAFSAEADAGEAPAAFESTDVAMDDMTAAPDMPVAAPASLEPPAAVEVLQEGGLVDGKRYEGRRISLDFNDVPVADVLRLIAEVSDLNLIAGDEVRGSVTIRLVDVPWDQALDVVLLTKGLGFIRVGNILRVAPADIIKQEEELRLQERRNKEKLEDLHVKLLPVNYAAVKDMSNLVKRLLTSRGTVNTDERTNTLIIKDIASVIDEAVALVKAIDTETPQVMIEAKIVEAGLDFARELGAEWALTTQPLVDPFGGTEERSDLGGQDFRFHGSNGIAFSNPITMTPTAALDMGAYLLDEQLDLNVALRAAESMGEGKVISSPRVVTLDNGEATIEQGVSIPFQTFESGDAKLEFIDAVLSLKVVPHITSDKSIIMSIEVTRNAPDDSVVTPTGSPAIAKAEASTETLVKDGQTLVLGGIYTIVKSERESRVPYLWKIPVIGPAFRSKEITDSRKELLIFVTPRIVVSPDIAVN